MGNIECCAADKQDSSATEVGASPPNAPEGAFVHPSLSENPPPGETISSGVADVVNEQRPAPAGPGSTFDVKLERTTPDDKFGFVNASRRDHKPVLVVTKITPDGLLAKWNREHPDQQVVTLAEIHAVNGVRDDVAEMREQLKSSLVAVLTVQIGVNTYAVAT
mmetsp:Transcript_18197/g.40190  ORF Transcript_18197/g.40190 Transcript_18197/m.40190 type:complete len:163 (-) Transcript_18197:277-765(-)